MNTNNIKKLRNQKNITMEELAKSSGISSGYLCHLENGTRSNPSYSVMKRISNALDKEIYEVFN